MNERDGRQMLSWQVTVDTAGGAWTASGQCPARGQVRADVQVPDGTLRSVRAVLAVEMAEDERVFMNGYQTWTCSPELGKHDRLLGLNGE